jgi:hypothetical protein
VAVDCENGDALFSGTRTEIIDQLRRKLARFNLCANLLEASSESFNLLPLLRSGRLQLKRAVPLG